MLPINDDRNKTHLREALWKHRHNNMAAASVVAAMAKLTYTSPPRSPMFKAIPK